MCAITENCQNCAKYDKGGCYHGPKVIVKIFGPMWVPATAWCNRFMEKAR
jgi:hypothetical protein